MITPKTVKTISEFKYGMLDTLDKSVIWATKIDKRFLVEFVINQDYTQSLNIFDSNKNLELIATQGINLESLSLTSKTLTMLQKSAIKLVEQTMEGR